MIQMYLAKLTTAQAKTVLQNDPIVVIPVGSTEQHGPQCALGTDFMIPSYLADRIADLDNVLVVLWNKNLYKEAGLDPEKGPSSIDEFVEQAKAVAADE